MTTNRWPRTQVVTGLLLSIALGCGGAPGQSSGTPKAALAATEPSPPPPAVTYVALGDSVAFGDNPLLDKSDPSLFIGYPDEVAQKKAIGVLNLGCPGESSGSLISSAARDNGCWMTDPNDPTHRIHSRALHVDYETSQLDYAVNFLSQNPQVNLVTLGIGSNDLLILQNDCEKGWVPTALCELWNLLPVAWQVQSNIQTIVKELRTVYSGPIVLVNVYALNYSDFVQNLGIGRVDDANQDVATSDSSLALADVYAAFKKVVDADPAAQGQSCAAGLLIPLDDGGTRCDIHPSPLGRSLLADTVISASP